VKKKDSGSRSRYFFVYFDGKQFYCTPSSGTEDDRLDATTDVLVKTMISRGDLSDCDPRSCISHLS
jgi:hypothetical protein